MIKLTKRQLQCLKLSIEGLSTSMIAEDLKITQSCVKYHISQVLKKSGCLRRKELIKKLNAKEIKIEGLSL